MSNWADTWLTLLAIAVLIAVGERFLEWFNGPDEEMDEWDDPSGK